MPSSNHILFRNATIIAFNSSTAALEVLYQHCLLIKDDRIAAIDPSISPPDAATEIIDASGKILTPGFINTHTHMWETAYRTLGPDLTLSEYFTKFGQYSEASSSLFGAEEVYISALMGYLEALNAGVTTCVEHAMANWNPSVMQATYKASVASGARIWWCPTAEEREELSVKQSRELMRQVRDANAAQTDSLVRLGYAWDALGTLVNEEEQVREEKTALKDLGVEAITLHNLGGPWKLGTNGPAMAVRQPASIQDLSIPAIFSHSPFATKDDIAALRTHDFNISITPESEMHYGHGEKTSHHVLDQASLGTDTPFTFSGDMLTQARMFLQHVRANEYQRVLDDGKIPRRPPMKAEEAFLLTTRQGGRALRRDDLGVLRVGAKADVVVFDTGSPNLVGSKDAVSAVLLHANVGDVEGVIVDGKWRKKDGRLLSVDWPALKARFEQAARKVQEGMAEIEKKAQMAASDDSTGPFGGLMQWGEPEVFSTSTTASSK